MEALDGFCDGTKSFSMFAPSQIAKILEYTLLMGATISLNDGGGRDGSKKRLLFKVWIRR